ncbi:MAG: putative phasin [Rhodospirillales bacterium]|nr:putative phasin [Rhodospirillales bacterium]
MNIEAFFSAMKPKAASTATPLELALASPYGGAADGQGVAELLRAFEQLTKRNSQKLKESMKALKAVKTPQAFMELQQKFMSDSMADAAKDGAKIGELAKTALTAAMEPMRQKIGALQAGAKR